MKGHSRKTEARVVVRIRRLMETSFLYHFSSGGSQAGWHISSIGLQKLADVVLFTKSEELCRDMAIHNEEKSCIVRRSWNIGNLCAEVLVIVVISRFHLFSPGWRGRGVV